MKPATIFFAAIGAMLGSALGPVVATWLWQRGHEPRESANDHGAVHYVNTGDSGNTKQVASGGTFTTRGPAVEPFGDYMATAYGVSTIVRECADPDDEIVVWVARSGNSFAQCAKRYDDLDWYVVAEDPCMDSINGGTDWYDACEYWCDGAWVANGECRERDRKWGRY